MSRIRLRILASALLSYLLNTFFVAFIGWLIWGTLAVKTGVPAVGYDVVCLVSLLLGVAGYLWRYLLNTMIQVNAESRDAELLSKILNEINLERKDKKDGQQES